MYGISPKLPLLVDAIDGHYGLTKTLREAVKQNFRNLILTAPGERIMDSSFGVGLKKYLFENVTPAVISTIRGDIMTQTRRYLSFIKIKDIQIDTSLTMSNKLNVSIDYEISKLGSTDNLFLVVSN